MVLAPADLPLQASLTHDGQMHSMMYIWVDRANCDSPVTIPEPDRRPDDLGREAAATEARGGRAD
jgi:hypothetical protein